MERRPIDLDRLTFDTILIKKSDRGFNLLRIDDFVAMPVDHRIELIVSRSIRFVNGDEEISPYVALESLEKSMKPGA